MVKEHLSNPGILGAIKILVLSFITNFGPDYLSALFNKRQAYLVLGAS